MRTSVVGSVSAVAAAVLAGGVFISSSFAEGSHPTRDSQPVWLTIPQLVDKLDAAGYRNIEKVEREHGSYEVRATDRDGHRVKLSLNPATGAIEDRGDRWNKRRDGAASQQPVGSRGFVECSKRRCRDDLPQAGTAAPAAN